MVGNGHSQLVRRYPPTSIIFDIRGLTLSLNHDSLCCRSRLLLSIAVPVCFGYCGC